MNEHTIPVRSFSHPSSDEACSNCLPIAIRLMDDHTGFVQEVPLDLQFLLMILAICVVEDVSKYQDIPIFEF